jgi:hypothetical protein
MKEKACTARSRPLNRSLVEEKARIYEEVSGESGGDFFE